jgi:hypothetical protein
VIGLGQYSAFMVKGLGYYFDLHKTGIRVFDGAAITEDATAALRSNGGTVWGAVYTDYAHNDLETAPIQGLDLKVFPGLTLVHQRAATGSPVEQAMWFLKWASGFRPNFATSLALLRFESGLGHYGPNLLPNLDSGQWVLGSHSALEPGGQAVRLDPAGPMANTTTTIGGLVPNRTYLLLFEFRNAALQGEQRVFASSHDSAGHWLAVFPDGYGYLCSSSPDWTRGAFAFSVPPGTTVETVWLRATGRGHAEFRSLELREADR